MDRRSVQLMGLPHWPPPATRRAAPHGRGDRLALRWGVTANGNTFAGGSAGVGGAGGASAPGAPALEQDGNDGPAGPDGTVGTIGSCADPDGC